MGVIRDLCAHMFTPNYVKHLSPTIDAIEKYAIFPLQPYNNIALMFLRSTMGHETSNVLDAAGTKFYVAKSHA